MQKVDVTELRRLHEAATHGQNWQEEVLFAEACKLSLPALLDELEALREALSQIYWKSIELGEDRGDSTINHIAADALKGDTYPLHARDRRMMAIGAAEWLEQLAGKFGGQFASTRRYNTDELLEIAAQLRREAGE